MTPLVERRLFLKKGTLFSVSQVFCISKKVESALAFKNQKILGFTEDFRLYYEICKRVLSRFESDEYIYWVGRSDFGNARFKFERGFKKNG